ncbi:MAG: LON peptidase substrate-binding domain-containing protein [Gemmataceae bacterium]
MSDFSPLAGFCGVARLFPLPNLVFFPHVMQPLHIFEPRYRQLTADALAGDRLITMVLPLPGWEADYAGSPALHGVGAVGKIIAEQKLPDGCYNILLKGLSRVQIVEEIPHGKLYRKARVELLAEVPVPTPKTERRYRERLAQKMPHWFKSQAEVQQQFDKLVESELPLGPLCDIFTFALPIDAEFKQTLLEELEVEERAKKLLAHLEAHSETPAGDEQRKFPPEFSAN